MAATYTYGAAPTHVKIASQTVVTASSTVTFSNIPQGYTDLIIFANPIATAGNYDFAVRYNEDSGSNYSWTALLFNADNNASPYASRGSSTTSIATNTNIATVNPYPINFQIQSYSNTTTYKSSISKVARETYATSITTGIWRNTAPITSVTFVLTGGGSTTFKAGASFTLYGIKAALVPKASGGDIVVQDGSYWYHAFRTTGSFQPKQSLSCDVLVVAGGGAGGGNGSNGGGGGGAGGIFYATSQTLSTAQTVTVGAGGASSPPTTSLAGPNGSNSTFGSLTAAVGGGGGGLGAAVAQVGGNAGGAGGGSGGSPGSASQQYLTAGGASTQTGTGGTGYGFAGGSSSYNYASAGGGGAGAVGASATSTSSVATGGAGLNTWSSWLYATGTGVSGYIAGGGGGGYTSSSAGGSGGGGAGGAYNSTVAVSGVANTGSGGGGSTGAYSYNISGAGGSGLIIVRYPI